MSYKVEYDNLADDYRQVVIMVNHGFGHEHRCGYVSVPSDHPWHGKDYHHEVECPDPNTIKVQESNPLGTFLAACKLAYDPGKIEISYLAEVHGGITYAGCGKDQDYPVKGQSWWFGFDAAHCGDDRENGGRPLNYMVAECEKLATFLKGAVA